MPAKSLLRLIGTLVLAVGLLTSVLIYRSRPPDVADDEFATKRDLYQLERIGGKSNEMAGEINAWFVGLWQGRKLAFTLGCLATGTCVACFILADLQRAPAPTGKQDRNLP